MIKKSLRENSSSDPNISQNSFEIINTYASVMDENYINYSKSYKALGKKEHNDSIIEKEIADKIYSIYKEFRFDDTSNNEEISPLNPAIVKDRNSFLDISLCLPTLAVMKGELEYRKILNSHLDNRNKEQLIEEINILIDKLDHKAKGAKIIFNKYHNKTRKENNIKELEKKKEEEILEYETKKFKQELDENYEYRKNLFKQKFDNTEEKITLIENNFELDFKPRKSDFTSFLETDKKLKESFKPLTDFTNSLDYKKMILQLPNLAIYKTELEDIIKSNKIDSENKLHALKIMDDINNTLKTITEKSENAQYIFDKYSKKHQEYNK